MYLVIAMNNYTISITKPGTKRYPLHQHPDWEIMCYLKGTGYLATSSSDFAFQPGTMIIVPPKTLHGSVSEDGFENISIGGNFGHLFMFDSIVVQQDDNTSNGKRLSKLIFENRSAAPEYVSALCSAYAHFLLKNAVYEKRINQKINKIIEEIANNFSDPQLNVTDLLNQSGYSEDYIRSEFKKTTALSPIEFLAKTRVEYARKLFEIYGSNLAVCQIAEACGFEDPIYFSRRFKQFVGISPTEYKRKILI